MFFLPKVKTPARVCVCVCVCVSSGVLGPFSPPGRKQRHSGLHHSGQRGVWHHRRPGHHHHVRLRRHAQCREWRVVCRPQVRIGNGPDWVCVHILSVWDIAKSTSMRHDWSLKSALRLSFIWDWQNDILAGEQGGRTPLKSETTNYPQGLKEWGSVTSLPDLALRVKNPLRGRSPMVLNTKGKNPAKDLEVRNDSGYILWNPSLLCKCLVKVFTMPSSVWLGWSNYFWTIGSSKRWISNNSRRDLAYYMLLRP